MKKLILAAAFSAAATAGFAGNYEDPIIEEPVIVEDTNASSSAAGIWIPLAVLAVVAAVVIAD